MKLKNKTVYTELDFLFSKEGKELQLCLVSQGYGDLLCHRFMVLSSSGLIAIKIIRNLEEILEKSK